MSKNLLPQFHGKTGSVHSRCAPLYRIRAIARDCGVVPSARREGTDEGGQAVCFLEFLFDEHARFLHDQRGVSLFATTSQVPHRYELRRWSRLGASLGNQRKNPTLLMSFGRPPSINLGFQATPPDRGSFPLDHFGRSILSHNPSTVQLNPCPGECKDAMIRYAECLKNNSSISSPCRALSKSYLHCRMQKCVPPSLLAPGQV